MMGGEEGSRRWASGQVEFASVRDRNRAGSGKLIVADRPHLRLGELLVLLSHALRTASSGSAGRSRPWSGLGMGRSRAAAGGWRQRRRQRIPAPGGVGGGGGPEP